MRVGLIVLLGGRPHLRQYFKAGYVEVAIVEELLQFGHVSAQEAPILVDAVAAQRRGLGVEVLLEEFEALAFGFGECDAAGAYALHEAAVLVGAAVPGVHALQLRRWRLDR